MTDARTTQIGLEVWYQSESNANVTQIGLEAWVAFGSNLLVTQLGLEVWYTVDTGINPKGPGRVFNPALFPPITITRPRRRYAPAPSVSPFDHPQIGRFVKPHNPAAFPPMRVQRALRKFTPPPAALSTGARVSQLVTETGAFGTPNARSSQLALEISGLGTPNARASQLVSETTAFGVPNGRVSQLVSEVGGFGTPEARISQLVLEALLLDYYQPPAPPVYPDLPGLDIAVKTTVEFLNAPVQDIASGREVRIGYSDTPIWTFTLIYNFLRDTQPDYIELKKLLGLFLEQGASRFGLLFHNPDDDTVTSQAFVTTDGRSVVGPLVRTYCGMTEPVGYVDTTKPFRLYMDGVEVDASSYFILQDRPGNQLIKFRDTPSAGHVLTVDMSYYYYCRFQDDQMNLTKILHQVWEDKEVILRTPHPDISQEAGYFGYVTN